MKNKQYHIFIDPDLMEAVKTMAKKNARKTSAEIMLLLEAGIEAKYGFQAITKIKDKQAANE